MTCLLSKGQCVSSHGLIFLSERRHDFSTIPPPFSLQHLFFTPFYKIRAVRCLQRGQVKKTPPQRPVLREYIRIQVQRHFSIFSSFPPVSSRLSGSGSSSLFRQLPSGISPRRVDKETRLQQAVGIAALWSIMHGCKYILGQ